MSALEAGGVINLIEIIIIRIIILLGLRVRSGAGLVLCHVRIPCTSTIGG